MNQTTIINKINDLRYDGLKQAYLRQIEDISYNKLSFEERLYNLLESQEIFLHNKKISMNLKLSKIKDKQAAIEDIDYSIKRKIDISVIKDLANMNFIRNHQNIIITGKTGTGKSYISQALGNRAIIDGFRVYYTRVPTLLEEIKISRATGTYTNLLKKYSRFELLILDDFGTSTITTDDATNLFEIIEDRTFNGSIIITAQLPIKDWHAYLGNETIADAMMDRLIHTAHKLDLKGPSMREYLAKL